MLDLISLSHNGCLIYLGTSLVTHFEEFKRFNDSIQACWQEIYHPAMRLEIVATCRYACENGQIYFVKEAVLAPNEISFTFTHLVPGSQCEFTLKAVLNPASIDKGISVTYMVLPASKTSSHIVRCLMYVVLSTKLFSVEYATFQCSLYYFAMY